MTFVRLQEGRVRISLDRAETVGLFGKSEDIDTGSPATKYALKLLLKKAVLGGMLRPDPNRLTVEMVKNLTGGYDIYFSGKGREPESCVFIFDSISDAVNGAKAALALGRTPETSRFYRMKDHYRMILSPYDREVCMTLGEFALKRSYQPGDVHKTEEYGCELIGNGAVGLLSGL